MINAIRGATCSLCLREREREREREGEGGREGGREYVSKTSDNRISSLRQIAYKVTNVDRFWWCSI